MSSALQLCLSRIACLCVLSPILAFVLQDAEEKDAPTTAGSFVMGAGTNADTIAAHCAALSIDYSRVAYYQVGVGRTHVCIVSLGCASRASL